MVAELLKLKCKIALGEATGREDDYKEMLSYFINLQAPKIIDPRNDSSIINQIDSEFENTVNIIEDEGHFNPKGLTEFSYYNKMIFLQKKFKTKSDAS